MRLRRQRYLPNDEPIVLRVDFYVQLRSISFTILASIVVDEIFGDAFERNVALADAKTRSFFSLLQYVREMEEHFTQHSEIGFALIVDRWIRENQLARLLERFCREAVGEKVIDGVFVDEREIFLGRFERDGVGIQHGEFHFLLVVFLAVTESAE